MQTYGNVHNGFLAENASAAILNYIERGKAAAAMPLQGLNIISE